jgi:hypothetical protein
MARSLKFSELGCADKYSGFISTSCNVDLRVLSTCVGVGKLVSTILESGYLYQIQDVETRCASKGLYP